MIAVILLLNLLDQPLKLVIIKQLRNVFLNGVHDAVPVLTLDNVRVGPVLPDDLDDAVLFIEPFVDDEVGHVQVLLAVVLGVDVIKLEHHVQESSVDQLRLASEVHGRLTALAVADQLAHQDL